MGAVAVEVGHRLVAVLAHFADGICRLHLVYVTSYETRLTSNSLTQKEKDENSDQDIKVVDGLVPQSFKEARFEQLVPRPVRDERNQENEDGGDLGVEEAGNQRPVETHGHGQPASKELYKHSQT
jgi:hypothetical protein